MGLVALLMILIAPIGQIVWSNRRLNLKTKMPIGGIVILMAALGVGLSVAATYLLYTQARSIQDHGTSQTSFVQIGGLLALAWVPIAGIIYGFIYYFKHPHLSGDEEAAAKINEVLKKHYKQ